MSVLETRSTLLQQLRLIVRTIREGRREKTLALFAAIGYTAGLALTSGKVPLPEEIKSVLARTHAAAGLFVVAAGLTVWLGVRLWREALPREGKVEIRPSAIKGPMSFGPQDGDLFLRLGRDGELQLRLERLLRQPSDQSDHVFGAEGALEERALQHVAKAGIAQFFQEGEEALDIARPGVRPLVHELCEVGFAHWSQLE